MKHRQAETHQEFLSAVCAALGDTAVQAGAAVPQHCMTDWSGTAAVAPLALVSPADTAQLSLLMGLCTRFRIPVVPQGGLSGLAGAAVPVREGIAVSMRRMAAIEEVDPRAGVLQVQAGATLEAVQQAAAGQGMLFGVDLGARGSCQIGGNVATNAGGNGVLQYGMMREQVLGLEVVLADGTVLPMLRPMLKNNAGYDLKQYFIGSEGTLGFVTRVQLRLRPGPKARATLLAALPDYDRALALLQRMQAAFGGRLAAFELMWKNFAEASLSWSRAAAPFGQSHPMLALIDIDGQSENALQQALEALLEEALEAGEVSDAVLAQSAAQARQLWAIREATAAFPARMNPPVNFDISLPTAQIDCFAAACQERLDKRWPGHHTLYFGHIGDGNLHVSTDGASIGGQLQALEEEVYALVAAFNGSVSAEHGIGLHKKPYLPASRSPQEIAAMRAIKHALDPLNLMNPGKVFD